MKKKVFAILLSVVLVFSCILSLTMSAGAFGDYDGGADFGDWDSDWDDDDDDHYYGGWSDGGSGGSGRSGSVGGSGIAVFIVIMAIIIFIYFINRSNKKKKMGGTNQPIRGVGATPLSVESLNLIDDYNKLDPGFSESQFKEKIANLFVQFQNGWQAKNLEPLRPYMSNAYYEQMDCQLDAYRQGNKTKMIERISVLDVNVVGWKQEESMDVMIVRIKSRFITYTVDDRTCDIIDGSRTAEKFMDYEWSLARSSGKTTVAEGGVNVQNCPNCGATVNINKTAKCEYCGSIITVDDYDWVVTGIRAIAQRTVG